MQTDGKPAVHEGIPAGVEGASPSWVTFQTKSMSNRAKLDEPFIIFKGGGYSGCFWEWNVISLKLVEPYRFNKAIPREVNVSGRAGDRVFEAFKKSVSAGVRAAKDEGDFEIVHTLKDWVKVNDDFNKGFVRSIGRALDLECKCDRCGDWFGPDEIYHTGYRGDGGIGVQFDDNHCYECADALHEEWMAENEWKYLSTAEKRSAIKAYNEDHRHMSLLAATCKKSPIPVYYWAPDSRPDLY